jgi:hypothetical protein
MSLCCLLIETINCYHLGMPTTSLAEWKRNGYGDINGTAPPKYKIDFHPERHEHTFSVFFDRTEAQKFFGIVDGKQFGHSIRNGLLHQAQTKGGWRIRRVGPIWDEDNKTLNRDLFASALQDYFCAYVARLRECGWESERFSMARRKLWWLIETSKPSAAKAATP